MKYCIDCGKRTKNKGLRCYSCAMKETWKNFNIKKKRCKGISESLTGRILSEKHCKNISESHKGNSKVNEAHKGKKNGRWLGGISRLPYSWNWNNDLKEYIRECDNHQCQFCGVKENRRKHPIHHIDYDKQNCDKKNLITLCQSHNSKANCNREKWQFCFEVLQEIKDTYKNKFIYK